MHYYCTLFDSNYVAHALSLADSLRRFSPTMPIVMFCMDEGALETVTTSDLPNLIAISLLELEQKTVGLSETKADRTRVEYFYTCTPAICSYVLNNLEDVESVTYLDADLYFFSSPSPVFEELAGKSIGIIEHRYSRPQRGRDYGRFNVGWITFRNDDNGRRCLADWTSNCIDWCYQRFDGDKYADQKYLDKWPVDYAGVHVVQHKGANVAPWNVATYQLNADASGIFVDEEKLLFYHFAGFGQVGFRKFKSGLSAHRLQTSGLLLERIYKPYANSIVRFSDPRERIVEKPPSHVSGPVKFARQLLRGWRTLRYPDVFSVSGEQ